MPLISLMDSIYETLLKIEEIGIIEYLYKKQEQKNSEELINILF